MPLYPNSCSPLPQRLRAYTQSQTYFFPIHKIASLFAYYKNSYCSELTSITVGSGVTRIESKSFSNCSELTDFYCYAENVPSIYSNAFEGSYIEYATLYVPEGSVDAYKAAPVWKEFKNILPIKSSTGIQTVVMNNGDTFDVYNLSGRKVKSKTTSLDGLPHGIYIINGKKVMK